MSTIRDLLATQPPSAINPRALVRAIAEHPEWYAPMLSFEGRDQFGHVLLPPDGRVGAVPDELWLFSDRAAVERAPQQLGFGTLSGIEVCASLNPAWQAAQLNPGSPDTLSMMLPNVVRSQLAQLAQAVPLERQLEQEGSGAIHALVAHPKFFIALDRGTPVSMATPDGIANGILVFTASDAVDGLFQRFPPENHGNLEIISILGRNLFWKLREVPIDGVLVNPFGPRGTVVVAREDLVALLELAQR
jgi:hypothetical protein